MATRRVVVVAPKVRAAVAPGKSRTVDDVDGELIGEAEGDSEYRLRVYSVCFDNGARRIRLVLQRGTERVRHLDVTASILRDVLPVLETAASLAGDLQVSDAPWWQTCSMPEFHVRAQEMTKEDRDVLIAQLKTAIFAAESEFQVVGSVVARSTKNKLIKKRKLLKSIHTIAIQDATRTRLSATDYSKRMLKLVGDELRRRYDDETVTSIFDTARARLEDVTREETNGSAQ